MFKICVATILGWRTKEGSAPFLEYSPRFLRLCDVQSFLQILEASRSRIDSVELDHREFEDEGKLVTLISLLNNNNVFYNVIRC